MKKIIITFIILFIVSGCSKTNENIYNIELKEPYNICGRNIYFSNQSYGNEIFMKDIIETIKEVCEYYKIAEAKEGIQNILYDNSLTRNEILHELKKLNDSLNR